MGVLSMDEDEDEDDSCDDCDLEEEVKNIVVCGKEESVNRNESRSMGVCLHGLLEMARFPTPTSIGRRASTSTTKRLL